VIIAPYPMSRILDSRPNILGVVPEAMSE
jgi:hypothetical protein